MPRVFSASGCFKPAALALLLACAGLELQCNSNRREARQHEANIEWVTEHQDFLTGLGGDFSNLAKRIDDSREEHLSPDEMKVLDLAKEAFQRRQLEKLADPEP